MQDDRPNQIHFRITINTADADAAVAAVKRSLENLDVAAIRAAESMRASVRRVEDGVCSEPFQRSIQNIAAAISQAFVLSTALLRNVPMNSADQLRGFDAWMEKHPFAERQKELVMRKCEEIGYTEPFFQEGRWWAFPPNGVMPVAIDLRD